jgi:Domain of Unknown Function (DUF748)
MKASTLQWPWLSDVRRIPRRWLVVGAVVGLVLAIVFGAAFLIDEPLRRYTEAKVNRALKGYTAHIGKLNFHPIGLSLDVAELVVVQDAHPDPPIASIPLLSASVHWRALLHGRLVGDFLLDRPTLHVNLTQAREEITSPTPVKERGWQDALEAIYPLKVNHFRVKDADVTYVDRGPFKPLRLRRLNIDATNIRNVKSKERVYPSEVELDAAVFESGHVSARGRADFLAEANPTFRGNVKLDNIELDYFKPITNRYNLEVDKGTLSAEAAVESAAEFTDVDIVTATITGIRVDYIHTAQTAGIEQERRTAATQKVRETSNAPDVRYRVRDLRISRGNFGLVNKAVSPTYRIFLSDTDVALSNFSNQKAEGTAKAHLSGKFMGTGTAVADASFRAETAEPSFDVSARIENVELTAMNDLLRAYGKFDVTAGHFFFYAELGVHDGAVTGYVKPLFKDMVVYDPEQDKHKSFARKMYEKVVGGVSRVLENRPHEEVATRADVSGPLENPKVNTLQVIVKLIQNAFFKAILPGFERESARLGRHVTTKGE